ncbi:MAG: hypothetical protein IT337_02405 [Thermomicrobiales bacterium]|nr:hypothetical protein [Thermomicrobiales bacterium]
MSAGAGLRRTWPRRAGLTLAAGIAMLTLAGCGPEAARVRGGAPGADVGNHGNPVVLLQAPRIESIFFQTPDDLPASSGPATPADLGPIEPLPTPSLPIVMPPLPSPAGGTPTAGATPGATPAAP